MVTYADEAGEAGGYLVKLMVKLPSRRYTEPSCRLEFCPDPNVMPGYVRNSSGAGLSSVSLSESQ